MGMIRFKAALGLCLALWSIGAYAVPISCKAKPEVKQQPIIQILTPRPNSSLRARHGVVTGTYSGPTNTGVTVNGVVAVTDGYHFIANSVPLQSGSNTITAVATTPSGAVAQSQVTVQAVGSAALELKATPTGVGIAPYKTSFKILYTGKAKIQSIAMDFNGDGVADLVTSDPKSKLEFTYASPSVFPAQVTITDIQGQTHQALYAVQVIDSAAADAQFQAIYSELIGALACEDPERASSYMTIAARDRYKTVFGQLKSRLRKITDSFSPLQRSLITAGYAEYGINRTIDGINRLFLVYFIQDSDGVWRIDSM